MLKVDISSFSYTDKVILKDVHLSLKRGDHLAILGESGCGKSTLLHLIYGLLHLENGSIFWDDVPLKGPRFNLIPGEDFMKLVAQEYNIMPYITVAENIATYLPRLNQDEDEERVHELLSVVEMSDFANTMVKDLSGGQKQRVALAKALAKKPKLLLLDEPFSNIDTFRKNKLRRRIFEYLKEHHISCITATHDAEEALAFSDKLLILENGKPVALGTPYEVYHSLNTPYLAGFFGEFTVLKADDGTLKILLPHQLQISAEQTDLKVLIKHSYYKGSHYLIKGEFDNAPLYFNHPESLAKDTVVSIKLTTKIS